MRKITGSFVAVLIAISAFSAVAMHNNKKKSKATQEDNSKNNTNIKSVLMGRAACYGQCPTYTIEIFENGLMRYTGQDNVPQKGVYEKMISSTKAIDFIKDFNTLRPDTLHYLYETRIADLPGIYYFISYTDSVKRVINADSGPKILREWAIKIDTFAHVDDSWILKPEDK